MIETTLLFLSIAVLGTLSLIIAGRASSASTKVVRIPIRVDEDSSIQKIVVKGK